MNFSLKYPPASENLPLISVHFDLRFSPQLLKPLVIALDEFVADVLILFKLFDASFEAVSAELENLEKSTSPCLLNSSRLLSACLTVPKN